MSDDSIKIYEDLVFVYPKQPYKNSIDGFEKKTKNQKWERPVLYTDEEYATLTSFEKDAYNEREYGRRKNGYWFYINGTSTFITGHHYFYLTYCNFSFGYPEYRDIDRRFFYAWDIVEKDPFCYGLLRLKFRRLGATSQGESIILNNATMNYEFHGAMISKDNKSVADTFEEVVDLLEYLPSYFLPLMAGNDRPKKVISFKAPAVLRTSKNPNPKRLKSLNSKIDYRATDTNAYDGRKPKLLFVDEAAKWREIQFDEFWQVHKTCLRVGLNIVGKAYIPSTANEMEFEGGKQYKAVWDSSSAASRNENGVTPSGLARIFFPAYDGIEGFISQYGESIIDTPTPEQKEFLIDQWVKSGKPESSYKNIGAKEYLINERKALEKDQKAYREFCRQFPFDEKEAFYTSNSESPFDLQKIQDQMEYNDANPQLLVRGNFEWHGGVQDTHVEWHPNPNGKWNVSWLQSEGSRNQKQQQYNGWAPGNAEEGILGADPVDNMKVTGSAGSNYAFYGLKAPHYIDDGKDNLFVCEYVNRLSDPDMMHEDYLKTAVFYGWMCLPERNRIGAVNHFRRRGYYNYLLDRPQETKTSWSQGRTEEKGLPNASDEVRSQLVGMAISYIFHNVGYNEKTNAMGRCYFNKLLQSWLDFNPSEKWTDYDEAVASFMCFAGTRRHVPKEEKKPTIIQMPTFNNKGMYSKRLK